MSLKYELTIRRFLKGFLAGGIGSVAIMLPTITATNITELKAILFPLISAFITGGILGLDKLLNFKEIAPEETPQ